MWLRTSGYQGYTDPKTLFSFINFTQSWFCLYRLYSEKGPSLGQVTTATGACGVSFVRIKWQQYPNASPLYLTQHGNKTHLETAWNIKQSSGNQVSSSTNHILPHHPDCNIYHYMIYLRSIWEPFFTMIYYSFIWKVLFGFICIKGHKMSGYATESYSTAEVYWKHDFSEGY